MGDRGDSTDEARRLADEAMAQIREAASRPPPPPAATVRARLRRRISGVGLALGLPALALLLVQNFAEGGLRGLLETPPSEAALHRQLLQTVSDVVIEIEAFQADYGELPETLAEVGPPFEGEWRYTLIGRDWYRIGLARGGQSVTFDSADDPDRVFAEVRQP